MEAQGKVFKFSHDIDTDAIISGRFLNLSDPIELSKHCFEDIRPGFFKQVVKGDIILAGRNFGCGSSREHAPLAIKAAGIKCVIAVSFARIFYRNSINIGLPVFECPSAYERIQEGTILKINSTEGKITDISSDKSFVIKPFPPFIEAIITCDGLVSYLQAYYANKK